MARVRILRPARARLRGIALYTEKKWGKAQRLKYMTALYQRFDELAACPTKGRPRDGLRQGLRSYSEGKHVIFYVEDGPDGIIVVDVLHQKMELALHLRPRA